MTIVLPRAKIEIAFVANSVTGALTWTDVTADYRIGSGSPIAVGRSDQYTQTQPGTFAFQLDNHTGNYTPENASGSHYPYATKGRAVRVTKTEDGVTFYPRYYGFINTITVGWDDPTGLNAYASITCVDLWSLLNGASLADDYVNLMLTADGPRDYWPMSDPVGTVHARNAIAGGEVIQIQLPSSSSGDIVATTFGGEGVGMDSQTTLNIQGCEYGAKGSAQARYDATVQGIAVECFFKIPSTGTASPNYGGPMLQDIVSTNILFGVYDFDAVTGEVRAFFDETPVGGSISQYFIGGPVTFDQWHHVAFRYSVVSGGVIQFYLDGVLQSGVSGVGAAISTQLGWWQVGSAMPALTAQNGLSIAHVAGYDYDIPGAEMNGHGQAGLNGFAGEDSFTHIARIQSFYDDTLTLNTIGTAGSRNMAPIRDIKGRKIGEMMAEIMATEGGILYVDRSGVMTARSRLARYNQAAALTLPADSYDPSLTFTQDNTNLVNDETATAVGSVNPQEVIDPVSAIVNGPQPEQTTLLTQDDNEALAFAQWRVGDGLAHLRANAIDVDLMTQQVTQPGLLVAFWQTDLGELVALSGLPTAAGASGRSLIVEGVTESLDTGSYKATIVTSPNPGTAWKLQDAVYGLLGSTTYLAY